MLRFFELVFKKSPTHPVHTAAEMTASTKLIQHSFELAAARCEDLTPLVYRRLFREHPEAKSMFRWNAGSMGHCLLSSFETRKGSRLQR